jgi:heptosyltransferase-2
LRKYPNAHVTWVTQSPANALLDGNPWIDRLLTTSESDLLVLSALEFDVAVIVDKSLKAQGVFGRTRAKQVFGFVADSVSGAILPATPAAEELWELGLSDHKKFFVNAKSETQLLIEAVDLGPFQRDPYVLQLSSKETDEAQRRSQKWSRAGQKVVIGINTGASAVIPYKRFSEAFQREIVGALHSRPEFQVVLLGGRDEIQLNSAIADGFPQVIQSPLDRGLRDGIVSAAACDIILSGDSLGMHLGIALQKWTVAWFGPTCPQEIDLYDRGRKILAEVPCSPCWKRLCDRKPMCYDRVPLAKIMNAIEEGRQWKISSSKPRFSETCSLPFRSCDL